MTETTMNADRFEQAVQDAGGLESIVRNWGPKRARRYAKRLRKSGIAWLRYSEEIDAIVERGGRHD